MAGTNSLSTKIHQEIAALSSSISGLIENFKELQHPLVESHEKVPQATSQLDKISEQTEAAAHQMLDMIEKITQREEENIATLETLKSLVAEGRTDEIPPQVDEAIERANTTLNDAFTIMDALQFQDITSQQMNHAAALLEDIETKLQNILSVLGTPLRDAGSGDKGKRERAYDPNADMFDRKTNQEDIDSLFEQKQKK